jgi:hypothetical protein
MTVIINGTTGIDTVQDGIITNAKILNSTITATKLAEGAISANTYTATNTVTKFQYGNAAPNLQPITTSFTLSEAEAPIGSYVIMSVWLTSGNSQGQQYCQLLQRALSSGNAFIAAYITGWYYNASNLSLFYIADASDRTFHVSHGTIASSNNNDFRAVRYHGYIKVTQ